MQDPEFEDILNKLNNLKFKKEIEEFDTKSLVSPNTKLNADFLLNLSKNPIKDKNITLGEYLAQYKNLDKQIQEEKSSRNEINDSDLSKLIDFINSEDDMKKVDIRSNKNLDDRIEKTHDIAIKNSKFISKGTPGVFSSLKSAVRQSNSNRFEIFSNTEARLIDDNLVSPLNLTQYTTKK